MAVNRDKPDNWKIDTMRSVDMYNKWFIDFAPKAFRKTRFEAIKDVEATLRATRNLTSINPEILRQRPEVLSALRMAACPPLAVDRLIGLTGVRASMVKRMENEKKLPTRLKGNALDVELRKICDVIKAMADPDIFVWIGREMDATEAEVRRAAIIVADRLCGSVANPIIRNAQEKRQFANMTKWLTKHGYKALPKEFNGGLRDMPPGTFRFHMNVPVGTGGANTINIPVDAAVMRHRARNGELPLLIEAKSAGDFANTNKRRKEEAQKINQLRAAYGQDIEYILFLCGYFDSGYLGYEAAEGIDWVWEHRIDDLGEFDL